MWNDFLEAGMISVVVAFSSPMPFAEVSFLGTIETDSDVWSVKLLTHIDVHEALNYLSGNETDIVVLQLDKNLSTFEALVSRTLRITHTFSTYFF